MNRIRYILIALAALSACPTAQAVVGVNPSGVNVRSTGVTTVFLTFQGLRPGQTVAESFWCGDVIATGVSNVDPCVPGTVFGRLPARSDLSTVSGTKGVRNLTDIMTIPTSVARRAYQAAKGGAEANFFYVRRFTGDGPDEFVTVTCRMAGGGARVPLALTDVQIDFDTPDGKRPVFVVGRSEALPPFSAELRYNGTGRLKGRWEVKLPGDPEPTADDLLTEATLPVELRGTQQRYTLVERFDVFLTPTGRYTLKGPDPSKLPFKADGPYKILLRIEASDERESLSNTTAAVVASGGVAGFPMPVLRYHVGSPETAPPIANIRLLLMLPQDGAQIPAGKVPSFSWVAVKGAASYLLEVRDDKSEVLSAVVGREASQYKAPPFLLDHAGKLLQWRVVGLNSSGVHIARSEWRALELDAKKN